MNYQIQPGDTLSTIAAKHGTTVAALLSANPSLGGNANLIRAGAALNIPVGGSSTAPAGGTRTIAGLQGGPALNAGTTAATAPAGGGAAKSAVSGYTPVQAGNGATVYVSPSGQFYDAQGNSVPGSTVAASTAPAGGSSGGSGDTTGGVTVGSTGNPDLDKILGSIAGVANNLLTTGYTLPSQLQITPALISDFLNYAHQNVDPYTQQQISGVLADVNANLSTLGTNYNNDMGSAIQAFGTGLATEQNNAANAGTAFSGARGLNENNMVASTNRTLSSLSANAANSIGSAARTAASQVGAANAGGIVLPSLSTGSVSLAGTGGAALGSNVGGYNSGGPLGFNYNPGIYTVGSIPSQGTQNVNQQEQSYISQYGTLANAQSNSGRSVSDLLGLMSGLPANYKPPTNLT